MIARWVPRLTTRSLGTDGFGRSDTREALRRHFETDAYGVVVAVLGRLAAAGHVSNEVVSGAIEKYGLATDLPDPWDPYLH